MYGDVRPCVCVCVCVHPRDALEVEMEIMLYIAITAEQYNYSYDFYVTWLACSGGLGVLVCDVRCCSSLFLQMFCHQWNYTTKKKATENIKFRSKPI